ncbi:hypothetical protein HHI36_004509 [Cryptolaemus montrouzieri]|uniref:Cadherin domain-containing protein n=1 Tax=Cryptolaemus montrouzieri TaxID=559131 RepID=A0ABD2NS27_9CUCU
MPIPPRINLTDFGEEIRAQDIDFSNMNINFNTTDNSNRLNFTTHFSQDSSAFPYLLQLQFEKMTRLADSITFEIIATDDGGLTTTANVTFNIDEDNSEPYVPAFVKPSFFYSYDSETGCLSAEVGEEVTLKEKKQGVDCNITGALEAYFKKPVVHDTTIVITLQEKLSDDIIASGVNSTTVKCFVPNKFDYAGYADVIISMPEDTIKFSKSSYNASYSTEARADVVTMDPISVEDYGQSINIKVDDSYSTYFEMERINESSKQWILSKKQNLDPGLLQNTNLIIAITMMLSDRLLDKATILMLLPNGETGVSFTSPLFTGNYVFDENDEGSLEMSATMDLNSQNVHVECYSLDGDYKDNFNISFRSPNTFILSKITDLPKEALKMETLPLTLQIDLELGTISQTVKTAILLYLSEQSTTSTTTSSTITGDCVCNSTVWIIVVIVLCLALIIYVAASLFNYFRKMRFVTFKDL